VRIVVSYRGIPHAPGWATGDSIVRALRRMGHEVFPYGNIYRTSQRIGEAPDNPDLLIFLECGDEEPQYTQLKTLDCPKVFWEFDTMIHEAKSQALMRQMNFDALFMANPSAADKYGATYLPYAADPDHFYPRGGVKSGAAIIGTPFEQRVQFARAVGIPARTGLFAEAYADAVSGLAVHVHHRDSGGDGLLVMRVWETLASGTLLLMPDHPTLRLHPDIKDHIITYSSADDCRHKVEMYRRNHRARERHEQGGADVVGRAHTYAHRVNTILGLVT
jgi:hypothetical protein